MKRNIRFAIYLVSGTIILSGCTTMKMKIPDFDSLKLPEFREEAENIGDYQDWASAPQTPNNLPSAQNWDESAKKIMNKRNAFKVPESSDKAKSNEEIVNDIKLLSDKVEKYKLDDPQ